MQHAKVSRAMAPIHDGVRERIGDRIGHWIAPAVGAIAHLRKARMFHPRGMVFVGRSEAIIGGAYASLGAQLDGRILARCSGALWKEPNELFEVLGIALRFRPGQGPILDEHPTLDDQDLLFATIRRPSLALLGPFTTDARDFMANTYYGASPFAVHDHDRVELRLEPIDPIKLHGARNDRFRRAVASGHAVFWLEARKTLTFDWHAVARITLEREIAADQEVLRFDPERTGCGVVPVGAIHAMRRAVYAASRAM